MKTSLRIARLELSTLFYSPVAWLVLVIFTVQGALDLTDLIERYESYQQVGTKLTELTSKIISDPFYGALLPAVQGRLYLYVPLLTMGLMSRELSSGSIKLLFSSPVKIRSIVAGKFMAMMAYGFLLILILGAFIAAASCSITALDMKYALSGLLGLYLLLCAYSAIGLFMSCLTAYQVVAAISTLVVLGALSYIGHVWQDIDIVRDITYFLSIAGRSTHMILGIISTKDICYFVLVIVLFLALSILQLQGGRESSPFFIKAGRYALLVSVVLLAGYLSSRPALTGYYDMTVTKSMTLTPNSQAIVKRIKTPLTVTTYANLLDQNFFYVLSAQRNNDLNRFERYTRFLPDTKYEYVYYYDTSTNKYLFKNNPGLSVKEVAQKVAKSFKLDFNRFLSPEQLKKTIDLQPEEYRLVRQLSIGNQKTFIRMFDDVERFPGEAEISAALKRLTQRPPRIGFITGNFERDIDKAGDKEYQMAARELTFRHALINQGFDVVAMSLETNDVPAGIDALVLADPRSLAGPEEQARLRQYIENGGNLLIAGEPGKTAMLNTITQPLGVRFADGMLVQQSNDFAPDFVLTGFTQDAGSISPEYDTLRHREKQLSMPGVTSLEYLPGTGFNSTPLLLTDSLNTWSRPLAMEMDSSDLIYDPAGGDRKRFATVALSLTRTIHGKEQRIMITGDADFMSNAELKRRKPSVANFAFMTEIFKWLCYGVFPVDTQRPITQDTSIVVHEKGIALLKILFLIILPGLLMIGGALLLFIRRRK